jgi:hypothetical protein
MLVGKNGFTWEKRKKKKEKRKRKRKEEDIILKAINL